MPNYEILGSEVSILTDGSILDDEGVWASCKILNPTCMSVTMRNNQQYRQLRIAE